LKPNYRQFNVRLPNKLRDDLIDLCHNRSWVVQQTIIDFINLGILVTTNPELHFRMNQIIEESQIVNVPSPDYVKLVTEQFEGIQKQVLLKQNLKLTPCPNDNWNNHMVTIMTHAEVET